MYLNVYELTPKLRTVLVLMILFAFPAISWFYLDAGLKYRMERVNELEDYGTLPNILCNTSSGDEFNLKELSGKWSLMGVSDLDDSSIYKDVFFRLTDAFHDRKELNFITLSANKIDPADFKSWNDEWTNRAKDHSYFLNKQSELKAKFTDIIENSVMGSRREYDYMFLVDTALIVRNLYDIRDSSQVDRMVEHVVLKLPYKK